MVRVIGVLMGIHQFMAEQCYAGEVVEFENGAKGMVLKPRRVKCWGLLFWPL